MPDCSSQNQQQPRTKQNKEREELESRLTKPAGEPAPHRQSQEANRQGQEVDAEHLGGPESSESVAHQDQDAVGQEE